MGNLSHYRDISSTKEYTQKSWWILQRVNWLSGNRKAPFIRKSNFNGALVGVCKCKLTVCVRSARVAEIGTFMNVCLCVLQ